MKDCQYLWCTKRPFTYVIDYWWNHLNNPDYVKSVAQSPPNLLHMPQDVPFDSKWGCAGKYEGWDVEPTIYPITPEQMEQRIEDIKRFIKEIHKVGVEMVMPYINTVTVAGDSKNRRGIWHLYDHWEEYRKFGLGERPQDDPVEWTQWIPVADRMQWPLKGRALKSYPPLNWYNVCPNNDNWRKYLMSITEIIASVGYDGVFPDVNDYKCYCPWCQDKFSKYLAKKYSSADLKRLFGSADVSKIKLGSPDDGLRWVETQKFRAEAMADVFKLIKKAGQKYKKNFLVAPNLDAMDAIDCIRPRASGSHEGGTWARAVDLEMFEKNEGPGLIGKDIISHNILQYKFAWANRFCAGMLLYRVQSKDATEFANTEAAAGGGGCFIQNGLGQPEIREKWRYFFENHDELLVGYDSASPVGVCFLYDQLWWDNWDHLREVFRLTDYLSARHIMFDYIVENSFKPNILARYQLIILPQCRYLSAEQIEWLREFIEQGGGLILTGRCGIFDHEGKTRDIDPFADLFIEEKRDSKGIVLASYGRGMCVRAITLDPFVSKRPFELFELSDEEREDTKNVLRLYEEAIGKTGENKQPWDGAFLKYANLLARQRLPICAKETPSTVRASLYTKKTHEKCYLALHLVNYNLPIIDINKTGVLTPTPKIELSLPLPKGWKAKNVRLFDADSQEGELLPFKESKGQLEFTVPSFRIYKAILVESDCGFMPSSSMPIPGNR